MGLSGFLRQKKLYNVIIVRQSPPNKLKKTSKTLKNKNKNQNLKIKIMKNYLLIVLLLGTFQGLVTSFGSDMLLLSCIVSYLFWGCMLMPMLGDTK